MDAPAPSPSDRPPGPLEPGVAARVEAIVRAAEADAATVRRDIDAQRRVAETESRRYLIESRRRVELAADERVARLRAVIDDLVDVAEATKQQFLALGEAIGRATTEVERETDQPDDPLAPPEPEGPPPPGRPSLRAVAEAPPEAGPAPGPGPAEPTGAAPRRPGIPPLDPRRSPVVGAPTPPVAAPPQVPPTDPPLPSRLAGAVRQPPPRRRAGARPLVEPPWKRAEEPPEPESTEVEPPAAAKGQPQEPPAAEAPPPSPPEPPVSEAQPATPAPPPEPPAAPAPSSGFETARLVALEMALAGHSRADVGRHLRDDFGITEPGAVLDAVFGTSPGSSPAR